MKESKVTYCKKSISQVMANHRESIPNIDLKERRVQ